MKLLPNGLWKKLLQAAERKPIQAKAFLTRLFDDMAKGGDFDLENILEFDGGLFDGRPALALEHGEIGLLFPAASLDWSLIDPTIFGTLFERFLDPDKRAQIGAHYTDPDKIMMIVEPVVLRPLRAEWEAARQEVEAIMAPALEAAGGKAACSGRQGYEAARVGRGQSQYFHRTWFAPAYSRPSMRLGRFVLSRATEREGHRMTRHSRLRGARPRHGGAARRAGNPARHRDQFLLQGRLKRSATPPPSGSATFSGG